jgi:SAM-dependent methyltransferase
VKGANFFEVLLKTYTGQPDWVAVFHQNHLREGGLACDRIANSAKDNDDTKAVEYWVKGANFFEVLLKTYPDQPEWVAVFHQNHLRESEKLNSTNCLGNVDYQKKMKQELEIYVGQVNVHDLPDIFHYWSNKYLLPMLIEAGFNSIDEFFSTNLLVAKNRTGSVVANFISVGSGNCDLEVSVAKKFVNAGFYDFIFECLEINPVMIERGKEIAKENGVLSNMRFVNDDFNTWVAGKKYDGVMANQSLHHVTSLEHLFDQINKGLHANGSFVISDIIGRNGHLRWPESLTIVNKFWKELPISYRFNLQLNRFEENEYENWDCSKEGFEGIRAQDILPLVLERFQCEKSIGYGSAIDVFVDRNFGHNFDPESEWDKGFIDRVHEEDEAGIISGKLTPTHFLGVFVKELHCKPDYSKDIDPVLFVRNPTH